MTVKNIALIGNPNVGKSTVFNGLTGLSQHTGNWPGKTVSLASGTYVHRGQAFSLIDLPGIYSLTANSPEEEVAIEYLNNKSPDAVVVVVDATCMERNLNLALQVAETYKNVVLCVNLLDEANKKGIEIDLDSLSRRMNIPVVGVVARSKKNLDKLKDQILALTKKPMSSSPIPPITKELSEEKIMDYLNRASELYRACVRLKRRDYNAPDRTLDNIVTSKSFGYTIMLLLLALVFWITLRGANYISDFLHYFLFEMQDRLFLLLTDLNAPAQIVDLVVFGIYQTVAWVVSVMLPPMAIFFPLFTLLEDSGYLPRVAFNMDRCFRRVGAHGKQVLTMCMGFGCNACAVMNCRIIDSPRERVIAILTNNFVPCNGRFPTLIALISMFFVSHTMGPEKDVLAVSLLLVIILLGVFFTLLLSQILSMTILKGFPSSFVLELPPYRRPQIGKVIVRSLLDRTIFVLGRAVVVAAPAGIIIWFLANTNTGDSTLLHTLTGALDPFARLFGLDGVILMAFILGFPANEIVVPIIIMTYLAAGSISELDIFQLKTLLLDNGWNTTTALCTLLFCLLHFPCGTTCLTVRKETASWKWTAAAVFIPTICGLTVCFLVAQIMNLFFPQ
jgi:ferrous iron transport protein B